MISLERRRRRWMRETISRIYERHAAGCCLHVVIDDGNYDDGALDVCAAAARRSRHEDCIALVAEFRATPRAQRCRIMKP